MNIQRILFTQSHFNKDNPVLIKYCNNFENYLYYLV